MRSTGILLLAALLVPVALSCSNKGKGTGAAASASASASVAGQIPAPPDVAAPPADAQKTSTGLASKVLTPGTGTTHPEPQDAVRVHYTGWTTDGKMFDSSVKRGQPARFGLKGVIPGWTEGLQLMVAGEKRRFWIPKELAYNDRPGKPQGMLVFDVELLEIIPGPKPIPAPSDVAAPPKEAEKTKDGLYTLVLQKGTGKEHPKKENTVKVNYTGWTADGKMLDSTVARGQPALLKLETVMPGWAEALQLMVPGEKRRMWIPPELAFQGRPGAPQGMLVYEMELIDILVPPKAPSDVAAAPKDAEKTASGLASKVLQKGTGTAHPGPNASVQVQYTGWTTDGKSFDSTVTRGVPATFRLGGVIPGWKEGLQLMVEGEKRRFWIPKDLAYKDGGGPQGMLVFDVELVKILAP